MLQRAQYKGKLSALEKGLLLAGPLLILAGVVTAFTAGDAGGPARVLASVGIGVVWTGAASCGVRRYRLGVSAALPTSVARVQVRVRPARGFNVVTVALALVLPLAAAVSLLALVAWAWLPLSGVLLMGWAGVRVTSRAEQWGERPYSWFSAFPSELLERLCMRMDMRVPQVVVEHGPTASAWTAGGRIHLTRKLLQLLDDSELEAVLAHELAHLARRDSAVMEICSAPSRVLLAFAGVLIPWTRKLMDAGMLRTSAGMVILGLLCGPPAFVIGWISRLSVLGMSRAREFSADAAAATLTGRPSALASALLKLDDQREWTPRSDLRQVQPDAVLCIVGVGRPRVGRLFSTHPPTAARVKRLEETEIRIQAASGPGRLWG